MSGEFQGTNDKWQRDDSMNDGNEPPLGSPGNRGCVESDDEANAESCC